MAIGKKTERKFQAALAKAGTYKDTSEEARRNARAVLRRDVDDPTKTLRKASALEKKYGQQLSKARTLAIKAGREIGLDINDQIIARRKAVKRGAGDIIERL
jgi:hypothetical protein